MEFVINKIMSIDKDAENYRKSIDILLQEKQKYTEKKIDELRNTYQNEIKMLKENILKTKLEEAEERAKEIRKEKELQINKINNKYESSKEKIINEVFEKIIGVV